MPVSADQSLPVVRVGDISSEPSTQALAGGRALGHQLGGCDRRRSQVRQDVAGAGHRSFRGHRHGMLG